MEEEFGSPWTARLRAVLVVTVVVGIAAVATLVLTGQIEDPAGPAGVSTLVPPEVRMVDAQVDTGPWVTSDPGLPPPQFDDSRAEPMRGQNPAAPATERLPDPPPQPPAPTVINPPTRAPGERNPVIEHYVPTPGMTPPGRQPYNPAFGDSRPGGF